MALIHPLLKLVLWKPGLLAEHARGYADLASADAAAWLMGFRRQAAYLALGVCALSLGLVLGGVSLMLWAVSPELPPRAVLVLWLVPAVPLALAAVCARWWGRVTRALHPPWVALQQQLRLDMELLRQHEGVA